jgi:hypothetical protein
MAGALSDGFANQGAGSTGYGEGHSALRGNNRFAALQNRAHQPVQIMSIA